MAIALVKLGTATTGTTSVSPTFGQATAAGDLLVAWLSAPGGAAAPGAPSGWSTGKVQLDSLNNRYSCIFYKANSGASETAPTFTDGAATFMAAALGEFSGADTLAPLDQSAGANGLTSTQVLTAASADAASGDLVIACDGFAYSMAATKTTSDTFNNGATATDVGNNDGTSSATHYRMSYGITTSNASADTNTVAFTITNVTATHMALASFTVPAAAPAPVSVATKAHLRTIGPVLTPRRG